MATMRGTKRSCSAEHGEDTSSPPTSPRRHIPGAYPASPSKVSEPVYTTSFSEVLTGIPLLRGLTGLFSRPFAAVSQYFAPRQYKLVPIAQSNGVRPYKKRVVDGYPSSPCILASDEAALPDPFVEDNIFAPRSYTATANHTPICSPEDSKSRRILSPQSVKAAKAKYEGKVYSPNSQETSLSSLGYKAKIAEAGRTSAKAAPAYTITKVQPGTNPLFFAQSGPLPVVSGVEEAYDNDLSELPDAPAPPAKKKVAWADFASAKPFYIDSTIAEMQDSFLEKLKQGHDFETAFTNIAQMTTSDSDVAAPNNTVDEFNFDDSNNTSTTPANTVGLDDPTEPSQETGHDLYDSDSSDFDEFPDEQFTYIDGNPNEQFAYIDENPDGGDSSDFDEDVGQGSSDFEDDPEEDVPQEGSGYPSPKEDSHDDSGLDESIISRELAESLSENFKTKIQLDQPTPVPAITPSSPIPPTIPPLISPLTDDEQAVLVAKSKACDEGKDPGFKLTDSRGLGRAPLTAHDFSRLLPSMFNGNPMAWLNDEIVNEYLAILVHFFWDAEGYKGYKSTTSGPSVDAMSSYWFKQSPGGLKRWFMKKNLLGRNFLNARLILLPICEQAHWRLAAIKPRERRIEYLDSLDYPSQSITDKILAALPEIIGDLYVAAEWTVGGEQQSIRQQNASDCGVFTLLNALVLVRGEEHKRVVCDDGMMDARLRIAMTLLAGEPTGEVD